MSKISTKRFQWVPSHYIYWGIYFGLHVLNQINFFTGRCILETLENYFEYFYVFQ